MKRLAKCKCGSTTHKYTNNPQCELNQKKIRLKNNFCRACKSTTHIRISSKLCPFNKVFI